MNADLLDIKTAESTAARGLPNASGFIQVDGESFYKIGDSDRLAPFLMNVVSGSNHWMFIASNGALTAGRKDADNALFPYCTQDKLFELAHTVGSFSSFWVEGEKGGAPVLWEPFRGNDRSESAQRNLYKNTDGSKVIFEEIRLDLGLEFRYTWSTGDVFGFARRAELRNQGEMDRKIRLLDGIQNLVPYGLDQAFVSLFSNLSDAYKKNELLEEERLGIYYLSSIPTDRAEPSEGLKATVAWSLGLENSKVLVSSRQVEAFRRGESIAAESETRASRCSYLLESELTLKTGEQSEWWIVADINQSAPQIESLKQRFSNRSLLEKELKHDIAANVASLKSKIGESDGFQLTAEPLRDARHRSNTLFNIMRGGIFDNGYTLSVEDFKLYLESWNTNVLGQYSVELDSLGETIERAALIDWARGKDDWTLMRLANEYLPLSFSRRHGDPSRPWNKFSIETQDEKGDPILGYQGNWRDIFQNWEPLAYSYPGYLSGMISRFLNSSTADGYNPYRVTRDGFDWEVLDPEEPWSNIGYWGDHQIIYLLKLLEALKKHSPETFEELLAQESFVYAHVPYRIRGFKEIWANPRDTVDYDDAAAHAIANRTHSVGADDKLLLNSSGQIVAANMWEKLLSPLLAKMSNFVADGGIWMNTQRPEWNDANNALVGYGVSAVTLCYVNRYLEFLAGLLEARADQEKISLDDELVVFLEGQLEILEDHQPYLNTELKPSQRFEMLRRLGEGGEAFRESVYEQGFGETKREISVEVLKRYFKKSLLFAGRSIDSNRREDGMYHSYNLLSQSGDDAVEIDRLPEMLEGQVAVLSSNRLSGDEALTLVKSLRESRLYRADVGSYLLYPDRDLPSFLEKNRVNALRVEGSSLLNRMIEGGDERVIARDVSGSYRFNGDFRNSGDVANALKQVKLDYPGENQAEDVTEVLSLFEDTFNHRSFTGRSGTFFAYEGLGSIYWHMVSKLVLAIQENCLKVRHEESFEDLEKAYFETLNGLGFDKSPEEYGAFPIDAYSHTPQHAGAQQPGMTGQVKEDILSRWGELGVQVNNGCIEFKPTLLKASELLVESAEFEYVDLSGESCKVMLESQSLAFTYCQTLVTYAIAGNSGIRLVGGDGEVRSRKEVSLTAEESAEVFDRTGKFQSIHVFLTKGQLR